MGWLTLLEARAVAGMGKERLRDLLLAGDVKLRFRNPNGTTSPVPPDWLTRATVDWANSRIVAAMPPWFQGPVEVDRQTLLANVADAAQPHGKSGGRPRDWDWEAAAIDVMAVYYGGGEHEPARQADVERLMQQWFLDNVGKSPAESGIREHAKKLFDAIKKA
jgi:hypothetical protein